MAVDDSYTKLLLHCNGVDASTTFTDENGKTVGVNGDAQLDTAQKYFGLSSGYFDGNGDYLEITGDNDFAFGTGEFTVDFWMRPETKNGYETIFDTRTSDTSSVNGLCLMFGPETAGKISLYSPDSGESGLQMSVNTWYHIALVGNGGSDGSRTIKCYINGALANGFTYTGDYNLTMNNCFIGDGYDHTNPGLFFQGWLDEIRVSKGVQRWTTDFTPPGQEYLPLSTNQLVNYRRNRKPGSVTGL